MKYFITAGQSLREPADAILLEWTSSIVLKLHFCESHFLHFLFPVTGCKCSPGHTHRHFGGCFLLYSSALCCSKVYLFHRDTGQDSEYLVSPGHSPTDPGPLPNSWQRRDKCFVCFSAFYLVHWKITNPAVFLHQNSKDTSRPCKERLAL